MLKLLLQFCIATLLCAACSSQIIHIQAPALPFPCRPPKVQIDTILPAATIDWSSLTVSGFSSGAMMAAQYVVANSAEVKGAGILAGLTYGQFYHDSFPVGALRFISGTVPYTTVPGLSAALSQGIPYASVSALLAQAQTFSDAGVIDNVTNLEGTRVFIFAGTNDQIVNNIHGYRGRDFFNAFGANVGTDLNHFTNHVLGTDNFPPPLVPANCWLTPGIVAGGIEYCGYEVVFEMFTQIYGSNYVAPPSSNTPATGMLYAFDQSNLTISGNNVADFMDDVGYLYVPAYCQNSSHTCKIHIALHGCGEQIYDNAVCNFFATKAGYLQVADANNVVIVFPQAAEFEYSLTTTQTNFACWDFYGGVSADFCWKTGTHIASIRKIAAIVAGIE